MHGHVQKRRNKVYCDRYRREGIRCTVHGQVQKRRNTVYCRHVQKRRNKVYCAWTSKEEKEYGVQ